ncbi:hypothetical protein [Xanthomonas sp. NCPPB 2632]|uniref:hypothetical protein n=1 Tax=Xanthomonas sp. NCPPB 2632 TaxID=3240912 RepID=UPI003518B5BC
MALVLHFRSAEMTMQCLVSLSRQGLTDVVLVDNSEDGRASLNELERKLLAVRMSVVSVEPGRNLGFAAGINLGMAIVERDFAGSDVLLINNDATLSEGTVDRLRQAVSGDRPTIAAPSIDGPTGIVAARTYYRHFSGTINPRGPGLRGHALLGGACLLLHRELARCPIFDDSFFFYGDDIELGFRMSRKGVQLIDVPEGLVIHQGSGSSGNGSLFYEYHIARAHLLLVGKLGYGPVGRAMLFAGRGLFLSIRALIRSLRSASLRPWKGLIMAVSDVARGRLRSLTPSVGG